MSGQQSAVLWIGLSLIVANLVVGKGATTLGALFSGNVPSGGMSSVPASVRNGSLATKQAYIHQQTTTSAQSAANQFGVGTGYKIFTYSPLSTNWGSLYNQLHLPTVP